MGLFNLDIHTVIVLLSAGNVTALVVLLSYRRGKVYPSYRYYAAAKFLQSCAWPLLGLRGSIPDFFSVYVGNSLLFSGFGFEALAMTRIDRQGWKWECFYFIFSFLWIAVFCLFASTPNSRVGAASAATVFLFGAASAAMLASQRKSVLRMGMGLFYFLICLILSVRSWYGFFSPGDFSLLSVNIVQTFSFLPLFILLITGGTGFLLLLKEKEDILLAESEEKYRTLVNKADEGISIIQDGVIVFVNQRMESLLAVPASGLEGMKIYDFILPDDMAKAASSYERRLNGDIVPDSCDFRLVRRDGTVLWVVLSSSRIQWNSGSAVMVLLTDISGRKKMEEEKEAMIAELQKALSDVKTLRGLLPICASCKKIRDDNGYWNQIEVYIADHSDANFSHSLCPDCVKKYYPEYSGKE